MPPQIGSEVYKSNLLSRRFWVWQSLVGLVCFFLFCFFWFIKFLKFLNFSSDLVHVIKNCLWIVRKEWIGLWSYLIDLFYFQILTWKSWHVLVQVFSLWSCIFWVEVTVNDQITPRGACLNFWPWAPSTYLAVVAL